MTPAQFDHLRAIDAHLTKLLDIAAKRTPGEWESLGIEHSNCLRLFAGNNYLGAIGNSDAERAAIQDDAAFIASCAGNAEAGWRLIRQEIEDWFLVFDTTNHEHLDYPALNLILAAFPLELIEA